MTKSKFFSIAGIATLLFGLGLNLQYALDDYGFTKNSLSGFMQLQASSAVGDNSTQKGTPTNVTVKCTITRTITKSKTSNSSNTKSASGEASGNVLGIGAKGSGKTDTTHGDSDGETETTTITETYDAVKHTCPPPEVNSCTIYSPCF